MSPSLRRSKSGRHVSSEAPAVVEPSPSTPSGAMKRTMPEPPPEPRAPGYRASRRSSKTGKQSRRQAKTDRVMAEVSEKTTAVARTAGRVTSMILWTVLSAVLVAALLWVTALGINATARWNARRLAHAGAESAKARLSKENLVVIGVKDDRAIGFVALKAERAGKRVLGFSIPDGAFVEVPGQGFESIGDSYAAGPVVSRDAVSNFLMVSFPRYVVVGSDAFQRLVTEQNVNDLLAKVVRTDLMPADRRDLSEFLEDVPSEDVWIVPMPVKPISVGDQRFFEPQRAEIADLVLQWWGVRVDQQKQPLRVIVYNGVGTPGVAGKAAQQLIREGFRVVDSKNADNFDYKTTQVLLYHGTQADAGKVTSALGVGEVSVESAAQDIADMIVIVGADYKPPVGP